MSSRSGETSGGALLGGIGRGFAGSLGLLGVRSLVGIGLLSLGGISGVLLGIGLLLAARLLAAAAATASGAAAVAGALEREEAKGCCDWTSVSANSKNAQGMSTWVENIGTN